MSEEYKRFLIAVLYSLIPRYYDPGELIQEQDTSSKEKLYIMSGNFKVAFFDMINKKED